MYWTQLSEWQKCISLSYYKAEQFIFSVASIAIKTSSVDTYYVDATKTASGARVEHVVAIPELHSDKILALETKLSKSADKVIHAYNSNSDMEVEEALKEYNALEDEIKALKQKIAKSNSTHVLTSTEAVGTEMSIRDDNIFNVHDQKQDESTSFTPRVGR